MAENVCTRATDGATPLHRAARAGDLTAVRLFLEYEADINAQATDGATALHSAVEMGDAATVKLLLEYGATVEAQDEDGMTALHLAVREGHTEIANLLTSLWGNRIIQGRSSSMICLTQRTGIA